MSKTLSRRLAALALGTAIALPLGYMALRSRDRAMLSFLWQEARGFVPSAPPVDAQPTEWTGSPEELDILEAVFRYQMEHNASSGTNTGRVEVYVLALGRDPSQDPPPALLDRLRDAPRPVIPTSEAEASWDGVAPVGTDRWGVLLGVERIRSVDGFTVDVDGGYYEGSRSASGNTYRLRRRGKSWRVVGEVMHWIS